VTEKKLPQIHPVFVVRFERLTAAAKPKNLFLRRETCQWSNDSRALPVTIKSLFIIHDAMPRAFFFFHFTAQCIALISFSKNIYSKT
jgi:hypothetical protein